MKIRQINDIHSDISEYTIPILPTDVESTLVLPGDIGKLKSQVYREFIKTASLQFKYVIFILGNHEYWGTNIISAIEHAKTIAEDFENVYFLHDSFVIIDDIKFIGSTLWTALNPVQALDASTYMNDYSRIRHGSQSEPWKTKLRASDTQFFNFKSFEYIKQEVQNNTCSKLVIITHHAPSFQSVAPHYYGDKGNCYYCTDYEGFMMNNKIDNWLHGHIHWFKDYKVGNCRVTCNPRGYHGENINGPFHEKTQYNDSFTFDV
jgi:predicted phosphohydrolase